MTFNGGMCKWAQCMLAACHAHSMAMPSKSPRLARQRCLARLVGHARMMDLPCACADINALSDATGCDPGSIIAMAGEMGFRACGIDLWAEGGEGRLSPLQIGRGYECRASFNPNIDEVDESGQVCTD